MELKWSVNKVSIAEDNLVTQVDLTDALPWVTA